MQNIKNIQKCKEMFKRFHTKNKSLAQTFHQISVKTFEILACSQTNGTKNITSTAETKLQWGPKVWLHFPILRLLDPTVYKKIHVATL